MRRDTQAAFPPLSDIPPPFPTKALAAAMLTRGLADLVPWWLDVRCNCGNGTSYLPLRLLAAKHGWRTPLTTVLRRLKCRRCGNRPTSVALIEDPAGNASGRAGSTPGKRLPLTGAVRYT